MFYSPWYFLFLLIIPLLARRILSRRGKPAVRFSALQWADSLPPTLRQRLLWLPPTLSLIAIVALVVALARPREGREQTVTNSDGIAIQMVVDRSGSMQAMDFKINGENVDRLTAIKNVVAKFVMGNEQLSGRFSDLIGLVTFAGYADGLAPLTLDHTYMLSQLTNSQIVTNRSEDGTAIGDAISLAVEKLNGLDSRREEQVKSKIMILLTDGENNAGSLEPKQAAELAQSFGIKIYTIGVGTKGEAPVPVVDSFTGRRGFQMMQVNIDEATLQEVSKLTGGKYFRATDTASLVSIYAEIDLLEKTNIESQNYVNFSELAVQPFRFGQFSVPPILLIALVALALRVVLEQTWLRELT